MRFQRFEGYFPFFYISDIYSANFGHKKNEILLMKTTLIDRQHHHLDLVTLTSYLFVSSIRTLKVLRQEGSKILFAVLVP